VTTTITGIGNDPTRIAVNPAGTRAYAACENGNLFVIDTATNTVIANVPAAPNGGIAVTPDGTKLYLLRINNPPPIVRILDAVTHADVAGLTLAGGARAEGLFIGPICPDACDDGNDCTVDGCNVVSGCTHTNATAGAPCSDGTFCNGADTCDGAGGCTTHPGDPCLGGPDCADVCDEANDTCNEPSGSSCTDDGNACTDDECDGAGLCAHPANSASCDDLLYCNGPDQCGGGTCSLHGPDPCSGGPECADTCNEATDTCFTTAGTPCAADGSVCTLDQCDGAGACTHPPGNAGTICRIDAGDCDVAEVCDGANASCPADGFEPNGTGCNDGIVCTISDQCTAGTCSGSPLTCGDGIVQGSCSEECDDGNVVPNDGCSPGCTLEPCLAAPVPGCLVAAQASIQASEKTAGKEKLKLQWKKTTAPTSQNDFGDPVNGMTRVALCLYDDDDALIRGFVVDRPGDVCTGKPCWSAKGTTGYGYKDKLAFADGITKISFGSGPADKGKADGAGANNAAKGQLALPTGFVAGLAGNSSPTIQLVTNDGFCIGATMAEVTKDTGVEYKARKK
jgi:cysteine-rich repeat protein/YVTN family beta-propeller protein